MNNDYLWDQSGPPDPEVQRLEKLLGGMRHNRPLEPEQPSRSWHRYGAVAAAAAVVGLATLLLTPSPKSGWNLEVTREGGLHRSGTLATGDVLETDGASRAKIALANFAELDIAPNSRLRLVESRGGKARLSLYRGLIHAHIRAQPGNFSIATPSATAVDLGCSYSLQVDDEGNGLLHVDSGWVSFEWQGREVFIPAGAACRTRRDKGPGIPYFEDSSDHFRAAVQTGDVDTALAEARPEDAFTLWHLLPLTHGPQREQVYDRIVRLAPPPAGVTREGVLALNGAMMDALWDSFGLDNTTEWRRFKRPWNQ